MSGRFEFAPALLAALCVAAVIAASALAAGRVGGPRVVAAGQRVAYRMGGLLADQPVSILVQPKASEGGNCCGAVVKGRWRTTATGRFTARYRFPARYAYGCSGVGCAGSRRFRRGGRAVIEFTVVPAGGTPDGTPVSELLRTVTVRVG
jgi:hypothetical protein